MPGRKAPYEDPQAFSQLYELVHLNVFRYIYSLHGGPQQDVEDLTAETFWRAWRARRRFQGDQKAALSWLLQIARRLVIDQFRRQKVRGYNSDIEEIQLPSNDLGPESRAELKQDMLTLIQTMQMLPLQQREILTLRYIFEWRVKDIGEYIGMAENTVSVNIRRSLNKLQQLWPEANSKEM